MNKNNKKAVAKTDTTQQPQRAAYSQFEIEKRTTRGMDGSTTYTGYYLLNLEEWSEPLSLDQLKMLSKFLSQYIAEEEA